MRAPDPTSEQAIAESRLRSITTPHRPPPDIPPTFQAFRTAGITAPTKPRVRILLAIAVTAAIVAAIYAWRSQPEPQPLPPPPAAAPQPAPSPSPTGTVTIDITGKVRKPGVCTLPTGSRVTDALQAAGGLRQGTTPGTINLARRLIDGEQIIVGPQPPGAPPPNPALADPSTTTIDLNTATLAELEQLPGVGEVLAGRILDYRTTHGGFHTIDQLREISGIGPRKFEALKPKVHV
ncbi:helix-hairpin-helix domain-containing protein [Nonomuraea sediminis]|uniref:helix-hairpin-helix domain-containing protein n=1 Tax=Nonomuraea sediminis TaxID=2835864 RepID=UPI001BDD8603|nr:helix-hairpin-helix domain-containing protein [Nonomuraea sediminis]